MIKENLRAQLYEKVSEHLFDGVLSFWEERTIDKEDGGYLTAFDRQGELIDNDKYIWLQGRQLWIFSSVYNNLDKDEKWLKLADAGCSFLLKHGYNGNGRWNYCLDKKGNVIKGDISIFSDMFAVAALSEYMLAIKDDRYKKIIEETFNALKEHVTTNNIDGIFPYKKDKSYIRHGVYSIALNSACIARQVLGPQNTDDFINLCMNKILYEFAIDEYKIVFEALSDKGEIVNDAEGRLVNPGHIIQSAWFCCEAAKLLKNQERIDRALEIAKWGLEIGRDKEYGGLFSFVDIDGNKPEYTQWHKNKAVLWDDKIWWANAECLYTLLLLADETGEDKYMKEFTSHLNWCIGSFYDKEYSEWYTKLDRDGKPANINKGNSCGIQKCAYHLPRALMKILLLLNK